MYRFVYIDDEDMARSFFGEVLDFPAYGFELAAMFATAEQADEYLLRERAVPVVITDIRMGETSGIDFCERLRARDPDVLLVLISGYREFEYARRAIKCDVFDYLLKPTSHQDIVSLFTRLKIRLDSRKQEAESGTFGPPSSAPPDSLDSSATPVPSASLGIVDMIKRYIAENYNRDITLDSLARHVLMNPAYLSRFIKQHMQLNFIDYLTEYRINRAIELLRDPTIHVGEVCAMVGYRSPQHFLRLFKQYTGRTPTEYRKSPK